MDSEWIVINAGVEVITRVEGEGGGGRDKTMFLLIRDYLLIYSVCLTLSEVTIRSILHILLPLVVCAFKLATKLTLAILSFFNINIILIRRKSLVGEAEL